VICIMAAFNAGLASAIEIVVTAIMNTCDGAEMGRCSAVTVLQAIMTTSGVVSVSKSGAEKKNERRMSVRILAMVRTNSLETERATTRMPLT